MRPPLPPGPYLVVGLARSGRAAARMLREHGETIGCDSAFSEPVEGVETHAATDGTELLDRVATVVKSPGVAREAPVVAGALERGLEVHGELELAWRLLNNRFIAVTGTNGKTTTVSLLGAMYETAGEPVAVAGNVGTPLASLVGELDPAATVVCETSSFQLEDTSAFAPECAVLLNIEPDHLDRHATLERYREAKLRAFANQGPDDLAVVAPGIGVPGRARRTGFTDDIGPQDLRLRGEHNLENARAAAAAALGMGVDPAGVRTALREFAGVPHRLEEVGSVEGVLYVNDSKATNVASAVRGLTAFPGGVHAILGGSLKGGGFRGLREAAARCRALYLIGQAEDELAADLEGAAALHHCGDLATAVDAAARAAGPGDVVLLSPACASYDHYTDYEERGAHFRRLVAERG